MASAIPSSMITDRIDPLSSVDIVQGDALEELRKLPGEMFHCCVTSPPYWNLRDYSVDGQLGQEISWMEYISKLVEIFHEVKRVLRKDGTLWLNMGDKYVGTPSSTSYRRDRAKIIPKGPKKDFGGILEQNLIGLPWRLALALQDDGWYLRCDCIWSKRNSAFRGRSISTRPSRNACWRQRP